MALEDRWLEVTPQNFIQNGMSNGYIFLKTVKGFKIRQVVTIKASGLPDLDLDVINVYPDHLIVGRFANKDRVDISDYTIALSATVEAKEQVKKYITDKDLLSHVYEVEPINAIRTAGVDENGAYGTSLKVEVDGKPTKVTGFSCPDGSTAADVRVVHDGFTKAWDDIEVTARRGDGQPAEITTRKGGIDVQVGTLDYFADGEFQRLRVVDA